MTPTPRIDAALVDHMPETSEWSQHYLDLTILARQLERDIAELNERLIDRQQTLMAQAVKLQAATRILTRCRNSAGRVESGLYEDIQNFLHTQP